MQHLIRYAALLLVLTILALGTRTAGAGSAPLKVAVTSPAVGWVVKFVGGDLVKVYYIVPPGVNPHTYEPPERELLKTLVGVDAVFITGPAHLPVEAEVKKLVESGLLKARLVSYVQYVENGLKLLKNPLTGRVNPHGYFYSYTGLMAIARATYAELSSLDPAGAAYFRVRLTQCLRMLNNSLELLREEVPKGLGVGLTAPPLQYVAADLGLNVTFMLMPGVDYEVTQEDVARLAAAVRSGSVKVMLVTDFIAAKYPKLLRIYSKLRIPYVIVPVSKLSSQPQEILPTLAGELLGLRARPSSGGGGADALSTFTLWASVAEAILVAILATLLISWRRVVKGAGR